MKRAPKSKDAWQQEMRLRFVARSIQYHSLLRYHVAEWQHCQVEPCVEDRHIIVMGEPEELAVKRGEGLQTVDKEFREV